MDTPLPVNQNPLFGDSFFNSNWLNPDFLFNKGVAFLHQIPIYFQKNGIELIPIYNNILFFFSLFFITLICYCAVRMFEIRRKEHKHLHHEIMEYAHHQAEREKKKQEGDSVSKNPRWVKTLGYVFSQHASDWKLAVIEADAMLESLLDQLGFKGDNLGDKLKSATQEKFRSLSVAWEVHTIRNRIAHEGTSFELSQHEAKRVIALYERIFREFGFI